jgi:hypothetical protein
MQRNRKIFGGNQDRFPSGIGGVVIDSDYFPRPGNFEIGNAGECLAKFVSPIVGRYYDRKLHF